MPDNVKMTTRLGAVVVGGDTSTSEGWDGVRVKLYGLWTSLVRTLVPILAGFAASTLTRRGFHISQAEIGLWLTPLLQGLWYSVPRLLEPRYPWMGWFLGLAKQPAYSPEKGQQNAPLVIPVPPPSPASDVAVALPPDVAPEQAQAVVAAATAVLAADTHVFVPKPNARCEECGAIASAGVHQLDV